MDGTWTGLAVAGALGVLAMLGRRFESAGERAVSAQGAAAQTWQELAVHYEHRAEHAEALVAQLQRQLADLEAGHLREREGLERRLAAAGEPVRASNRDTRDAGDGVAELAGT